MDFNIGTWRVTVVHINTRDIVQILPQTAQTFLSFAATRLLPLFCSHKSFHGSIAFLPKIISGCIHNYSAFSSLYILLSQRYVFPPTRQILWISLTEKHWEWGDSPSVHPLYPCSTFLLIRVPVLSRHRGIGHHGRACRRLASDVGRHWLHFRRIRGA